MLGTVSKAARAGQRLPAFIDVGVKLFGNTISFFRILRRFSEIEKNLMMKEDELEEYQNRKLRRLIPHAYQTVPFYRRLFDSHGLDPHSVQTLSDLSELPIINKKMLRAVPISQRISRTFIDAPLCPRFTGGSTGEPFAIYLSREELELRVAHWLRIMFFHGCTLFDREGTVAGLSGRVKRGFFDRLGILRKVELPFDALLSDQVKTLVDKRPELLVGYPSRLYLIACYLRSHHVRVVPPKAIFSDSETLFPFMRETIEQAFRVRVTNLYDSYEFGYTAWECSEHDGLHINSDHQIVQIMEDKREVEDGQSGDIVTTDLDNYAMPLIRYDTFDVGAKSKKKCKCGLAFPMLESVSGRKWDFLVSPSGETIPPLLVEQFIRKSSGGIEEYQITQNSRETLHIDVVVSNDYDYGADTRIKTQLQDLYHFRQIYVHHPSHVKRTRSGKWRCVVRNC